MISSIIHFFIKQKICKQYFTKPKLTNCKDETINHSSIYLLFELHWLPRKVFCKIMQHMVFKKWFPLWFNMRHHEDIFVRYLIASSKPKTQIFQKIIPQIFSNFSFELTRSWNQNFLIPNHEIIFHQNTF